jgi:hypothetical protein
MILHPLHSKSFKQYALIVLSILVILLVGCTQNTPEATRDVAIGDVKVTVIPPTQAQYTFKTSEPGSISIHGFLVILNPMSMIPAPEDSIYLVPMPVDDPIAGIPQFDVGTVPQADVDEVLGEFVFTNIQPGQYAVVVITSGGSQIPVRFLNSSSFAILTLDGSQTDTTVDVGQLTLP